MFKIWLEVDLDFIDDEIWNDLDIKKLKSKFLKAVNILKTNIFSKSVNFEKLQPKTNNIYSFRLYIKYRVLCFKKWNKLYVFDVNNHYK